MEQPKTYPVKTNSPGISTDNVNKPVHYQGSIEVIDILKDKLTPEQLKGFCLGNVLKYVCRAEKKNGLEDLKKAQWYLNYVVGMEKKK